MSVSLSDRSALATASGNVAGHARLPRWFRDYHGVIAAAIYVLVIVAYEHYPIAHIGSVCECQNSDPTQWMWSWKWFTYALSHGQNPLLTNLIWSGAGHTFDLGAVTLAPLTAIPGIPLDALFGPLAAYNLLSFAAPVISGWAAYRLCRYVSGAPWASILAGYVYGFSAFELGQLVGHVNLVYTFVPPMLVHLMLRYANGQVSRRRALLGATGLLLIQFGLETEMLFDVGLMVVVVLVTCFLVAPARRPAVIKVLIVLVIAALVMGVICSYYIYQQLRGPAETAGRAPMFPADLMSFIFATPTFRFGGIHFAYPTYYTYDFYEQDEYLGFPLIGILLAYAFSSWRLATTKVIAVGTLVAFILALGTALTVFGHAIFPLPYQWLDHLPLFNETTPTRYGIFISLGAALAAVLWISRAGGRVNTIWRWLVALAAVALLLPAGQPAGWIRAPAQPAFFTTHIYRTYVKRNEVVLTIPDAQGGDEMLWQADTDMYFRFAGGYFGYPPPWDSSIPFFTETYYGGPAPASVTAPQLRSLVTQRHIGVVLVQQDEADNWPALLVQAGFHQRAVTGGIEVFNPPTSHQGTSP